MKRLLALSLCSLLAACSDSDVQEVRQWMDETAKTTKTSVAPIAPPKTFVPFSYSGKEAIDPFNPQKLTVELARAAASSKNPFKPDMERKKELLESFPLDTIKMVGVIQKGGQMSALLQIDKSIFQVRTGQYIGQNFGLVTAVSETAVSIREVVQDAAGEWVERQSKLELQESKETKK
ncbi:pilus assembly protein PilP [Massilia sp. TS11]|uniref:pilus assembly protein PilP n=1 Tax=Massilia sp. TS11 TaxID=2908003 RepID=UPI001EDC8103|nr:pilus assembly protein PilP [Massilia sp. TS11]MCG2584911.1 pilus assembly protein PilP [Massilia sp. TS11]